MTRPPTIIDVAREAGVSRSVVSRVLRGEDRVSPEAIAAVNRAVREVGYTPNMVARSLKERVSRVVGVVASDLKNPYYVDILHGVYEAADLAGYQVIVVSGHEAAGGEEAAIRTLVEFRVAGVILAGPSLSMRAVARLTKEVPVAIEGRTDAPNRFDLVTSDDEAGARLIVEHLTALGHRRIVVLDEPGPAGRDRRDGFTLALRSASLVSDTRRAESPSTAEGGYETMRRLLRRGRPPTAVACGNDVVATGAMSALEEAGHSVPEHVSVTGFDDIGLARMRQFDLTTIRQDRWAIGRACFTAVHRRANDPENFTPGRNILQPRLIVRGSTGAVAAA